jgi:hypothetical protein
MMVDAPGLSGRTIARLTDGAHERGVRIPPGRRGRLPPLLEGTPDDPRFKYLKYE